MDYAPFFISFSPAVNLGGDNDNGNDVLQPLHQQFFNGASNSPSLSSTNIGVWGCFVRLDFFTIGLGLGLMGGFSVGIVRFVGFMHFFGIAQSLVSFSEHLTFIFPHL